MRTSGRHSIHVRHTLCKVQAHTASGAAWEPRRRLLVCLLCAGMHYMHLNCARKNMVAAEVDGVTVVCLECTQPVLFVLPIETKASGQ